MNEKFNSERNVIITAKDEIKSTDVEKYIKENLKTFPQGSQFIVFCGHHHHKNADGSVQIAKSESKIVADYNAMFENVIKAYQKCDCKANCEKCQRYDLWLEKKFKMGLVLPLYTTVSDSSKVSDNCMIEDNCICGKNCLKFVLNQTSKNSIEIMTNYLLTSNCAHTLIFASCYSQKSEINNIMRASGLFSALTLAEERGGITSGKVFKLDPEQQLFLKKIAENPTIRVVVLTGHYGTGKTMLGAEAVKIISARLKNADVLVLTFNTEVMNYKLLHQDLKNKWFHGQKNLQIQDMTDFVKTFMQELRIRSGPFGRCCVPGHQAKWHRFCLDHSEDFQEASTGKWDINFSKYNFYDYDYSQRFKNVLVTICEVLNNQNKNFVIMMDEVDIRNTCRKTTDKEGQTSFHMDFSYLANYQNIHFVICLNPIADPSRSRSIYIAGPDFKMICPSSTVTSPSSSDASGTAKPIQHYQFLRAIHRCSWPILQHIKEFQKNEPPDIGYPNIDLAEIPDNAALPPILDPPGCGVIWVPLGIGAEAETKGLNKVKNILIGLKGDPSVSIICHKFFRSDSQRLAESLCHGNSPIPWNGPYGDHSFNGLESSVVVYFCDNILEIQSMARARQLLIIITHGKFWNDPSWSKEDIKRRIRTMNISVEKGFVRKIGDTEFTKILPEQKAVG